MTNSLGKMSIETYRLTAESDLDSRSLIDFSPNFEYRTDLFLPILQFEVGQNSDKRVIGTVQAARLLFERFSSAKDVIESNEKFIHGRSTVYASRRELRDAYYECADSIAGMISYDPGLISDYVIEQLKSYSVLAKSSQDRLNTESEPRRIIANLPLEIIDNPEQRYQLKRSLIELDKQDRINKYADWSKEADVSALPSVFSGVTDKGYDRARALFEYSTSLNHDELDLKSACLFQAISDVKSQIEHQNAPAVDDLVGVFEYFNFQSLLGRSIHDLLALDGVKDDSDRRALSISIEHLTNARDAYRYVRHKLIDEKMPDFEVLQTRINLRMREQIGVAEPGTYGNRLLKLSVNLHDNLSEAGYFADKYHDEYMGYIQAIRMQEARFGKKVLHVISTIESPKSILSLESAKLAA